MVFEPRGPEDINGSDLSGADNDSNRTYTLTHSGSVVAGMSIIVQGQALTHLSDFTFSNGIITFLNNIRDYVVISINYFVEVTTTFTGSVNDEIRVMLIGENNIDVVPDDLVNVSWSQAANMQSSNDSLAKKLYTCWLIATRWQSLGRVIRLESAGYKYPDPTFFQDQYNMRLSEINSGSVVNVGMQKVSLNKKLGIDDNTKSLRSRRSGDVV